MSIKVGGEKGWLNGDRGLKQFKRRVFPDIKIVSLIFEAIQISGVLISASIQGNLEFECHLNKIVAKSVATLTN